MKYDINLNSLGSKASLTTGMYPVIIYQLIRQCSNINNKLEITDIEDTLAEYWQGDHTLDSSRRNLKKTIRRNLNALMYLDSNISAEDKSEEQIFIEDITSPSVINKVWYDQEITTTEIQLLTDAIIHSKHFTNNSRQKLISNLFILVGESRDPHTRWIKQVLSDANDLSIPAPTDLYYNLEFLNEAIEEQHCISFTYNFTGPDGAKYPVMSFKGVSAYIIFPENGIYYLVASRRDETASSSNFFNSKVDDRKIVLFEIHKLDKLSSDYETEYIPIEETDGKDKTILEIMTQTLHAVKSQRSMIFCSNSADQAILQVNAKGLDVLIDSFGNRRLTIQKLKKTETNISGISPELQNVYKVTLNGIIRNDWYDLVILKLRFPNDISILEPSGLIDGIIYSLDISR